MHGMYVGVTYLILQYETEGISNDCKIVQRGLRIISLQYRIRISYNCVELVF